MPKQPSGTPASFVLATSTGQAVTGAQDLVWTQVAAQNIVLASNTSVTLTPGHRYICEAELGAFNFDNASGILTIAWVDSTNAPLALSDGGSAFEPPQTISGNNDANKPNTIAAVDLRSASANVTVKLRVISLVTATTCSVSGTINIYQS